MSFIWCDKCGQIQDGHEMYVAASKKQGGTLNFRIGRYVRCNTCWALFLFNLGDWSGLRGQKDATTDQGKTILQG